jgi:TolB-like protein/DNA-binding SARP family transcriptional activator/Tfp pilus assembly protein PilF
MAVLEVTLFGVFEARLASGQVIELPGQKDRALLAVLALPPGATHSRDKLANLLWSDRGDQQARDSLKHALTKLRQCLPLATAPVVVADRQSARLDPAAVSTDVAAFERLLSDGTPEALEQATALYRGDFLDGIGIRDPAFEDWLLVERQRLRQLVEDALTKLLTQSMVAGVRERAAAAARRLLSLDPLREAACRALMQIHAEQAQTAQALKLYEVLRDRLHRELDVEPEPETVKLYESIRQRRAVPAPAATAATRSPTEDGSKPAAVELPLPSKPSIAVLAFENLSGDPEQEYFADGMVEDIITALSRMRWLFVIARSSSFTYKGRAVDVKQIGRELGVRYVLEGSVRKAANRVRITGKLIDATTGNSLWADRFDGAIEDVFDLQEQVTARVVGAIAPELEQAEIERSKRKPTESLDAYDYFLRGMACVHRWTKEANNEALRMFYRAIELDSDFASAYGMAARCYSQRKASAWMVDRAREIAETARLARRAVELGKGDAVALCMAGIALAFVAGERDDGAALIDRSLALNPNWAWAWLFSGWAKVWSGEPEVAIDHVARAMRLSPHDPQIVNAYAAMASAHFFAGRYAEASSWAEMAVREQPHHFIAACMAAASDALGGQLAEARKAVVRLLELDPALRLSNLKDLFPIRRAEDFARWEEGMRRAGLPE